MAGNKSDEYQNEKVSDDEGKNYAKEIDAIYLRTSAKSDTCIDEIFNTIGNKILDPKLKFFNNLKKDEQMKSGTKLKNDSNNNNNNKGKKCC